MCCSGANKHQGSGSTHPHHEDITGNEKGRQVLVQGQPSLRLTSSAKKAIYPLAILLIVVFLLQQTGYLTHVVSYWPYALILLCPLMHLFHGHGSHNKTPE